MQLQKIVLCSIFAWPLFAETLQLQDALARALAQNRELLAARKNAEAARFNYRAAYANFFPQITAGVSYTQGNSATTAQLAALTGIYELYSASLGVSQNLFSGLADYYRIKQARASAELAEANYAQTAARVRYELLAAWAQWQFASAQQNLTREIRNRRQENARIIRLRFQSGNENKGSLLLAESYLAQAERDFSQSVRQKRTAEAELRRVLNLPAETEIMLEGEITLREPPENPDLATLAEKTPEYRQAQAQLLNAEATADAAIAPFFPTLNASGNVFRQGPTFFPQSDRWSVSVGISYPLFNGGRDYYTLKANRSSQEAAKKNCEAVRLARIARLEQALQNWRDAFEMAKVSQALLEASQVRAEIARRKYNNGLLSFDQWDIIENELINRQRAALEARYNQKLAQASWEQLTGEGL